MHCLARQFVAHRHDNITPFSDSGKVKKIPGQYCILGRHCFRIPVIALARPSGMRCGSIFGSLLAWIQIKAFARFLRPLRSQLSKENSLRRSMSRVPPFEPALHANFPIGQRAADDGTRTKLMPPTFSNAAPLSLALYPAIRTPLWRPAVTSTAGVSLIGMRIAIFLVLAL
ncbi:hypothetical protein [Methylocystis rosea]|uniref:hypothetical protein n=1 Tax=Methylocystis rosea TaxID=173366 RepID=UPI0018DEA48E|nr:hypothetical protein [Methylocystis rosea]